MRIGSETQAFHTITWLTGIQRVIMTAHAGLNDRLSPAGITLVPLHTRTTERVGAAGPLVAQDPVMQRRVRHPDEVDAILLLDLNTRVNLTSVHRAQKDRPRPVIALLYDVIPLKHSDYFSPDVVRQFRIFLQQVFRLADHVIVTSHAVKEDLQSLGWTLTENIHVIPLGTAFSARRPLPVDDERLALAYVSTLQPHKGHHALLDAYDLLRADVRDVSLTLIGGMGVGGENLEARIRAHPDFGGRLIWLASPPDLTLEWMVHQCSVGVIPSEDEGFGLFLEEGLSLGLKMVVNDIPVFRERPNINVTYSEATPASLAQAIYQSHCTPWRPPERPVRTMTDFTNDLADLVLSIVGHAQSQHWKLH
jgi:glycosyltransferase involved in cell wall biosynthesis